MKNAAYSALLGLIFLLGSCSSSDDTADPPAPTAPPSNVSTDPAIRDTGLDLIVMPDMFYVDILTEKLSQTNEVVTRDHEPVCSCEPLCPACWVSDSEVIFSFAPLDGRMKSWSLAAVRNTKIPVGPPPLPSFSETCVGRTTLMREFTVDDNGTPGTALAGSVVRFNTAWLGRLYSGGTLTEASYEVRFIMRDLTEGNVKIDQKLADNTIKGELRKILVKGVFVPVVVPGWSVDETDDERHAFPIPLITGHSYRIQVTLTLTTVSGVLTAWSSFNNPLPGVDLGGFVDNGFLEFSKIDLDIGN